MFDNFFRRASIRRSHFFPPICLPSPRRWPPSPRGDTGVTTQESVLTARLHLRDLSRSCISRWYFMVMISSTVIFPSLSLPGSFHYSRTNACTVLHPLTWYLYFLVYKICGLFFASHKKEKITAKWILRQNSVYHNKTAYIINFSCEAMTTNFFVWCKDFAATDAKNIMYATLLWIWRLWGLRKWNKLSFFVCRKTKGGDYTFPWLYCCLTGGGSYRPLHPMHIELKFIGMPILLVFIWLNHPPPPLLDTVSRKVLYCFSNA